VAEMHDLLQRPDRLQTAVIFKKSNHFKVGKLRI